MPKTSSRVGHIDIGSIIFVQRCTSAVREWTFRAQQTIEKLLKIIGMFIADQIGKCMSNDRSRMSVTRK